MKKKIQKRPKKVKLHKKRIVRAKPSRRKKVAKKPLILAVKRKKKTIRKKKGIVRKIHKVKKVKRAKKISAPVQNFDLSVNSIFRPKIRVIGIGGGGGSIVSEIGRSLEKASFIIADTDLRAIKKRAGIKYFYFGEEVTHGLGTGMNPDLAREAAEKEKDRISKLLEGQDIIILVSSLGGGLGSGATSVFAELSQKMGNVTFGIFTLPFKFEGKKKLKISNKAVEETRKSLNALITIANEKIFKIVDEKTSITDAFSLVNKNLIGSLESLIDLIHNPGVINIDFADVRAILRGRGMMAFLNTAEATGKNRAEEVINKIFDNPLYNNNIKAEKILFNIAGSNNLSMVEVDKISKSISALNPKAKIIFGISKNPKANNRIKITLLITGPSFDPEPQIQPVKIREIVAEVKEKEEKVDKKIIKIVKKRKVVKKNFNMPIIKTSVPIGVSMLTNKPEGKKEMIRRSALEVKKVQEAEEGKKLSQEAEWEIPAFLRRTRYKA